MISADGIIAYANEPTVTSHVAWKPSQRTKINPGEIVLVNTTTTSASTSKRVALPSVISLSEFCTRINACPDEDAVNALVANWSIRGVYKHDAPEELNVKIHSRIGAKVCSEVSRGATECFNYWGHHGSFTTKCFVILVNTGSSATSSPSPAAKRSHSNASGIWCVFATGLCRNEAQERACAHVDALLGEGESSTVSWTAEVCEFTQESPCRIKDGKVDTGHPTIVDDMTAREILLRKEPKRSIRLLGNPYWT